MAEDGDIRIPGFRIERELGRGAMGVVYLAYEVALGRRVALKVLRHSYGDGAAARARFEREVRASARLQHPNIVPILSTGDAGDRLWYAMEFIAGPTLEEKLESTRHGRIRAAQAVRIARDLALALHAAHAEGVTHRDVKPGNVMLVPEAAPSGERTGSGRRTRQSWLRRGQTGAEAPTVERPLLTDFGLATDSTASKLSESGMLIGTPGYMAPEQYRGQADAVGPHSDQWALGVLLYECLTGTMPFPTGDLPTLARLIGHEEPIPPSRLDPRLDRDLETICLKCLSKNPHNRYADCAALAEDLGHWLREEGISARPPGPFRRLAGWARRRPVRATAATALLLVVLVGTAIGVGLNLSRSQRVAVLQKTAAHAMHAADFGTAEQLYDEWIALDPSDGRPRDLRARARALSGLAAARQIFEKAKMDMHRLAKGREHLERREAQARLGKDAPDGIGLGAENARGSEPWWMRERAYYARRFVETKLRPELAREWAAVTSDLAIARSLLGANARAAGAEGLRLQREIQQASAAWHMAEWRHAIETGDAERAALHKLAVEQIDPAPYAAELQGARTLRIEPTHPPSAAWLFRYRREGDDEVCLRGGPRLLPLPHRPGQPKGPVPDAYRQAVAKRLEGEGRRRVGRDVPSLTPLLQSSETHIETLGGRMRRESYEALLAGSSYPLACDDFNALGRHAGPLELTLLPGRYLLVRKRPGHPDLRQPFEISSAEPQALEDPDDLGLRAVPIGFVLVPAGESWMGSDDDRTPGALPLRKAHVETFLTARYELTYADYWEFLNDPRTLAEIEGDLRKIKAFDARLRRIKEQPGRTGPGEPREERDEERPQLRFIPRTEGDFERPLDGALPTPRGDGRGFLPMDNPEHPLSHISLYDLAGYLTPPDGEAEPYDYQVQELADALLASKTVAWGYLRWRTLRSLERAKQVTQGGALLGDVAVVRTMTGQNAYRALRFTLPTEAEWERMARGGDRRVFVYGNEREWTHFKGLRSRRHHPAPEAVGLFPEDESVFGVRDLTGSVAEWTSDWVEEGGVFRVKGHAWASQVPEDDRIGAGRALPPGLARSGVGVRLVVRLLTAPKGE